jgi:transcriptional regulator
VTVHVHGHATVVDASETGDILKALVEKFEAARTEPWSGALPADFFEAEMEAIVGFEMAAERIEGKFKLSQNRSTTGRSRVIAGLQHEGDPGSRALAAFMQLGNPTL